MNQTIEDIIEIEEEMPVGIFFQRNEEKGIAVMACTKGEKVIKIENIDLDIADEISASINKWNGRYTKS